MGRGGSQKFYTMSPRTTKHASDGCWLVPSAQGAPHRILPAGPFAGRLCGVNWRRDPPLALPRPGETVEVRADAGGEACKISGAERGGLHHGRTVDRRVDDVGEELHGDVARRHAAVDAQHRAVA